MNRWLLLALICLTANLYAASALLKSSQSVVSLDDQFTLTLTVEYPSGYTLKAPDASRLLWQQIAFTQPAFTLVSQRNDPAVALSGTLQQQFHYELEPWQEGKHRLGLGVIFFKNGQEEVTVLSNTVEIEVLSPGQIVLQAASPLVVTLNPQLELDTFNQRYLTEEKLQQPLRNRTAAERHTFPWHYLVGYFAVCALAALGGLRYRRVRKVFKAATIAPKPYTVVLSKLSKLENRIPKTVAGHDVFFVELSSAIRAYLEQVTGSNAPEQTTPEFLAALANSPALKVKDRQAIAELLMQADLVKFAAQPTTVEACRAALQAAKKVVDSCSDSWI